MSCSFITTLSFWLKNPSHGFTAEEGWKLLKPNWMNKEKQYIVAILLIVPRCQWARMLQGASQWASCTKNAPQPRVLSLDCSAKLRWNPSVMKKCFIKRFSVSVFAVSVSVFKILSVKWGVSSGLEMKKVPFRRHLTVMQISLFWFEYKLLCHYSTSLCKSLTKCSSLFVFWLNQLLHRCNKKQCCWRNPYT